ncbi:MAG: YgiQ family radical SAM protein [Gammaproteobacteria bacterium]|nr:YgiQ family radical SAM protein [Gammaproteobacteria bacterium]
MNRAKHLFSYRRFWAHKFTPAPFLPMSREEMYELGWDSCDVILVTGDAYVDHPSFGMAVIGRTLETQGFRVGIIAQPDWNLPDDFRRLGRPNLYFGVTGGNMDSMVNRYTSERRIRSDDAYTPGGKGGQRPDRAVIVYSQRCREAFKEVPVVIGGIEASLRRIAHFDYWQEKVRRSVLTDSKADMLLFGNGERAIVDLTHRLASGETIRSITDLRGTALMLSGVPADYTVIDSSEIDEPGSVQPEPSPYLDTTRTSACSIEPSDTTEQAPRVIQFERRPRGLDRMHTAVRLPGFEQVKSDPVLYAHASRILHLESNPGNARALIQAHGNRELWINPPPVPLQTDELDGVFELPYQRVPHPVYGGARIPAYEMIRFSVNIMRGCFGGCTFCSITEHEGRIIQNRSEKSILKEIETLRDTVPGFTGNISDLGGPTANMWRLACRDEKIEASCRRLSCVYPGICKNLDTNQMPLVRLYRKARGLPGIKRVFIASGLRYDIAVETPEYVKELVTHHVGGYLKIAPEHTEDGPLSKMMKPGTGTYDHFKTMFDKYSREAGKEQYLIPYFIAAHPGTTDRDMMNLAIWLKRNGFRADQVQAFLPSPMALASTMWHTGRNPLKKITRLSETLYSPKGARQRRLHKAFLRYHDAENWPLLREALKNMGRSDLIGNGKRHLIPRWQPAGTGNKPKGSRHSDRKQQTFHTKHTGIELKKGRQVGKKKPFRKK